MQDRKPREDCALPLEHTLQESAVSTRGLMSATASITKRGTREALPETEKDVQSGRPLGIKNDLALCSECKNSQDV